jgi:toxin ParE1/3/4
VKRYRVIFHPRARRDLIDLRDYIEEQSGSSTAARFVTAIRDYCLALATFPERGTRRNDLGDGVRVVGFRRRISIAFSVENDAVWILGIFYGGRTIALPSWEDEEPLS